MDLLAAVRRRAWDSRFYDMPERVKSVPTMLTPEEGKMLCWLGEHYYQGQGAIADMGCFLGGSTVRLAGGLARSGRPWKMYSYDRFTIDERLKQQYLYSAGRDPFEGQDMLHVFKEHIAPFAANITAYQGDVLESPRIEEPIEILFVDVAKSPELNAHIIDGFFRKLIPGRSIIVQQDYLFYKNPWVIATMELLNPKIQLVSWTRENSALFFCREAIDADDVERARYDRLSKSKVEELILDARRRFPFDWQREVFSIALDMYRNHPDETRAWAFPNPNMANRPSLSPWSE
jgi:predicted O-methyltransferase YrrM